MFLFRKYKTSNLFFSVLVLSVLSTPINAQKRNRSERYIDAYKKYLTATCPIKKDSIRHFVYFAKDRELIKDHPLLSHSMFLGAQIMYAWRELEPEKGKYDFSILKQDYEYLRKFGKKLFIQLQDVTFNPKYKAVPDYLLTAEYDGGAVLQYKISGMQAASLAAKISFSYSRNVDQTFTNEFSKVWLIMFGTDGTLDKLHDNDTIIPTKHFENVKKAYEDVRL